MKKEKQGRPSKLTDNFLKAAEQVLNEDMNAIIYTDEELLFEINQKLPEKEKICFTTWKNYKSYILHKEKTKRLRKVDKEKLEIFLALYKKALNYQKKNLFKKLEGDDKAWQRWAWIIERKFSEWNLRHIGEVKQETEVKGEIKIKLPSEDLADKD